MMTPDSNYHKPVRGSCPCVTWLCSDCDCPLGCRARKEPRGSRRTKALGIVPSCPAPPRPLCQRVRRSGERTNSAPSSPAPPPAPTPRGGRFGEAPPTSRGGVASRPSPRARRPAPRTLPAPGGCASRGPCSSRPGPGPGPSQAGLLHPVRASPARPTPPPSPRRSRRFGQHDRCPPPSSPPAGFRRAAQLVRHFRAWGFRPLVQRLRRQPSCLGFGSCGGSRRHLHVGAAPTPAGLGARGGRVPWGRGAGWGRVPPRVAGARPSRCTAGRRREAGDGPRRELRTAGAPGSGQGIGVNTGSRSQGFAAFGPRPSLPAVKGVCKIWGRGGDRSPDAASRFREESENPGHPSLEGGVAVLISRFLRLGFIRPPHQLLSLLCPGLLVPRLSVLCVQPR